MTTTEIINKTMDLNDLDSEAARVIIEELNCLIRDLRERQLKISSWYGKFDLTGEPTSVERVNRGYGYTSLEGVADDSNFPWFLYWEIAWVVLNNEFIKHHRILDLGGSSSLFSYYLASKGLDVTTVDLQRVLVDNANFVAQQMHWNLKNYVMDMRTLSFDTQFDHITSICVYEHIPMYDRIEINGRIRELLVNGGNFSITFDYRNPSRFARISSPTDVYEQFVKPSGLAIRANQQFVATGQDYLLHPFYYAKILWKYKAIAIARGDFSPREFFKTKKRNDYTFGALFLKKADLS